MRRTSATDFMRLQLTWSISWKAGCNRPLCALVQLQELSKELAPRLGVVCMWTCRQLEDSGSAGVAPSLMARSWKQGLRRAREGGARAWFQGSLWDVKQLSKTSTRRHSRKTETGPEANLEQVQVHIPVHIHMYINININIYI